MKMKFSEYHRILAEFEGLPYREMVHPWNQGDIAAIKEDFRTAVKKFRIEFDVDEEISKSALGNRIEHEFRLGVNKTLTSYELCECDGNGYPDDFLRRRADVARSKYPCEIKAKTVFCRRDGNRQVFLSASGKLRHYFPEESPICHLFGTVFYSKPPHGRQDPIPIIGFLLEFLQPWTIVDVRLESSASQRLLFKGAHERLLVVPEWVQADPIFDMRVFESFSKTSAPDTSLAISRNSLQPVLPTRME
jgi:hypothetical protein